MHQRPRLARFTLSLPLFASLLACSQTPSIKSTVLDEAKVANIEHTIAERYPHADTALQLHILTVAVQALDNMVFIEGGSYMMGDFGMPCEFDNIGLITWTPDAECGSYVDSLRNGAIFLHKVTLSNYLLSKYKTTYYDMNAYRLAHQLPLIKPNFNDKWLKKTTPVKNWQEAKDYCTWLGEITGYPFDLPTEAQWEYAARDRGKNIYYATNDGQVRIKHSGRYVRDANGDRVWQDWQPEEWNYPASMDYSDNVGSWPANPLGIYGLTSGALEWVNDWFSADYYKHSPEQDPQGPEKGTHKVQRGGQGTRAIATARYIGEDKKEYYNMYGFRCALQQKTPL